MEWEGAWKRLSLLSILMEGKCVRLKFDMRYSALYYNTKMPCFSMRRITEVVRGVKGANCQKITEEINKQLGTVVHTENTEEMFEQELVVEQTVNQEVDGGWGGTTPSW